MKQTPTAAIIIDTHVHFHECFAWPTFFDAAAANFANAAATLSETNCINALILCDNAGETRFEELTQKAAAKQHAGDWEFAHAADQIGIVARRAGGPSIVILPGRQIQTQQGLEILALCTNHPHADGSPIEAAIQDVVSAGGIAVVPWGFGKWIGKRGDKLTQLLESPIAQNFCLGDNSGRLAGLGEPAHFALARRKGRKILAGTDPLPFPSQQRRVGAYGVILTGNFSESRANSCVKELLSDRNLVPKVYGTKENLSAFVFNQTMMQIKKRISRRRAS